MQENYPEIEEIEKSHKNSSDFFIGYEDSV